MVTSSPVSREKLPETRQNFHETPFLHAPDPFHDKATVGREDLAQLDHARLGEMAKGHIARSQKHLEFGQGRWHLGSHRDQDDIFEMLVESIG